ncbi:MAG TPA: hypothetical protein VG652_10045 [Gaiellaceae bacterium]|nr:hypothetical protein [Gaiellaceae bacterium]
MRRRASLALLVTSVVVAGLAGTAGARQDKKAGPIKACVFFTYDDALSSGIVKMTAAGAAGIKGTFTLTGKSFKTTLPFTVGKNSIGLTSFPVSVADTVTITVKLASTPPRTHTIKVKLNPNAELNQSGCTPA